MGTNRAFVIKKFATLMLVAGGGCLLCAAASSAQYPSSQPSPARRLPSQQQNYNQLRSVVADDFDTPNTDVEPVEIQWADDVKKARQVQYTQQQSAANDRAALLPPNFGQPNFQQRNFRSSVAPTDRNANRLNPRNAGFRRPRQDPFSDENAVEDPFSDDQATDPFADPPTDDPSVKGPTQPRQTNPREVIPEEPEQIEPRLPNGQPNGDCPPDSMIPENVPPRPTTPRQPYTDGQPYIAPQPYPQPNRQLAPHSYVDPTLNWEAPVYPPNNSNNPPPAYYPQNYPPGQIPPAPNSNFYPNYATQPGIQPYPSQNYAMPANPGQNYAVPPQTYGQTTSQSAMNFGDRTQAGSYQGVVGGNVLSAPLARQDCGFDCGVPNFYFSVFAGKVGSDDLVNSNNDTIFTDDGPGFGVALGQRHGYNLRSELEYAYRTNDITGLQVNNVLQTVSGDVTSYSGMANAYWEFMNFPRECFKPYLGAGVGFTSINTDIIAASGQNLIPDADDTDSSLAYQFMAGVNYKAYRNMDLFLEYRFFAAESLRINTLSGSGSGKYDYQTDNLFGGLRWKF